MIPHILEHEDGRVKVTAEAFAIPEIKALLDKYDMKAEPYLSYVYAMAAPDSPYCNIPNEEKVESVVYDIKATLGEFDYEDELVEVAIEKLRRLYASPEVLLAEELAEELHRLRKYLRDTPIQDGAEGNLSDRRAILKEIAQYATNYAKVRKQADDQLRVATKGDHEVGGY
jgi:hypothetical protein